MTTNLVKKLVALVVSLAAASAMASVTVPKGTDVMLTFDQAVNSSHAHVGDRVKMHISNDVIVNGVTVLRAGTPVLATIESVRKNERFGINANLKMTLGRVHGIPLMPRIKGKDSGSRADHAAEAAGAGAIILGPIGLLGSYFVVGKPVEIAAGSRMQTEVAEDTVVR